MNVACRLWKHFRVGSILKSGCGNYSLAVEVVELFFLKRVDKWRKKGDSVMMQLMMILIKEMAPF